MTEEERIMLRNALASVEELRRAFLEVPPGSPKDARPLLEEVRLVTRAYARASWATRATVYLLPVLAGLGVSFQTIRSWFQ